MIASFDRARDLMLLTRLGRARGWFRKLGEEEADLVVLSAFGFGALVLVLVGTDGSTSFVLSDDTGLLL